jgi:CheY-like chemotaxis protein
MSELTASSNQVPANADRDERLTILVVDDSRTQQQLIAEWVQDSGPYRPLLAGDGQEALASMTAQLPALVLTDVFMPKMDGLQLVRAVRSRYPQVPVVLMTANGSEELAFEALQSGAVSYVPKRCLHNALGPVLAQVLANAKVDLQRQQVLGALTRRDSEYLLPNEVSLVPPVVALLKEELGALKLCDRTALIRCGVALEEALLNAIYHGNLELSSALRESGDGAYEDQARERARQSPYASRRVTLLARLATEQAVFVITDQGPGFDLAALPDPTDPANMEKASGRGLLLIRTFMDEVRHNPAGNQITLVKRREAGGN